MFNVPDNREQVYNSLANNVKSNLPNSNPWKRKSWIRAVLIGFAGLIFDFYQALLQALDAFFDDTTYGVYLKRKASIYGLTINPALKASGYISFTGTPSTIIPIDTPLVNSSGKIYKTLAQVEILNTVLSVSSLSYDNNIATVVCTTPHYLGTGMEVDISGATPSELNGLKNILVIDAFTFTYPTDTSGTGTATGTIEVEVDIAYVEVESDVEGYDNNMDSGDTLTVQSSIIGLDGTAYILVSGIGGGADQESEDDFKQRYIFRKQNPVTNFNDIAIIVEAQKITYVKRVFVQKCTPAVGQVTIYFLKAENEFPSPIEVGQVKTAIDAIAPSNTDSADIFVDAPTPLVVDFVISGLSPYTATMKQSVINRLEAYFYNKTIPGRSISVNELISVIQTTIDIDTGDTVQSFALASPSATVTPLSNEIPILGSVAFA